MPAASPAPVVLDVDTGVDDACALLFAARHPALELRAVTCVAGNVALPDVVRNTLTVLETCARTEVPVAAGAARPLLGGPASASHVHGADGMGDLGRPVSSRTPWRGHAVELLREVLGHAAAGTEEDRVTLVALAPLTNLALLLRTYPEVAPGIRRLVFMGGAAVGGNATASAEFNVFSDPEAAAIVLDACAELGVETWMYGLDVFYRPRVTRRQAEAMVAADDAGAVGLAGRLVARQCDWYADDSATIGDAGAVCAVVDPGGLTTRPLPVRVELAGAWSRGRTVVDQRTWAGDRDHDPHGPAAARMQVALAVEAERYARLWVETLAPGGAS